VIWSWDTALMNGINAPMKEGEGAASFLHHMKRVPSMKRTEPSADRKSASTLTLVFPASRIIQQYFSTYNYPSHVILL
jgi:hypothetical protein